MISADVNSSSNFLFSIAIVSLVTSIPVAGVSVAAGSVVFVVTIGLSPVLFVFTGSVLSLVVGVVVEVIGLIEASVLSALLSSFTCCSNFTLSIAATVTAMFSLFSDLALSTTLLKSSI